MDLRNSPMVVGVTDFRTNDTVTLGRGDDCVEVQALPAHFGRWEEVRVASDAAAELLLSSCRAPTATEARGDGAADRGMRPTGRGGAG